MILCNLPEILGKRRLKIAKVAADTGISRTTLTSLYYDSGKGVQFETINSLCIYLNIGIGELFTTLPFDIFIENCEYTEHEKIAIFECKILTVAGIEFVDLESKVEYSEYYNVVDICFSSIQSRNTDAQNQMLTRIFEKISREALDILQERFSDALIDSIFLPPYMQDIIKGHEHVFDFPTAFVSR